MNDHPTCEEIIKYTFKLMNPRAFKKPNKIRIKEITDHLRECDDCRIKFESFKIFLENMKLDNQQPNNQSQ